MPSLNAEGSHPIDIHPLAAPSSRPDCFVCYNPHRISALLIFYPPDSAMPCRMAERSVSFSLEDGEEVTELAVPVNMSSKVVVCDPRIHATYHTNLHPEEITRDAEHFGSIYFWQRV
jgi:hypothetical protein